MSGIPYHAWTHLPKAQGGTDPIDLGGEWAYMHRSLNRTIASGSGVNPFFDLADLELYDTSDPSCIAIADGTVDAGFSGMFIIHKPGIYIATAAFAFTTNFAAQKRARVTWAVGNFSFLPQDHDYEVGYSGTDVAVTSSRLIENIGGTPLTDPGDSYVRAQVAQVSGSDKTLGAATFHMLRVKAIPTVTV